VLILERQLLEYKETLLTDSLLSHEVRRIFVDFFANRIDSNSKSRVTDFAAKAQFFIIDEISMIGKKKLQVMHQKLGFNLGESHNDHIFGNRSFLFAGDFQQFPPIGDPSLVSKQATNQSTVRKWLYSIIFNLSLSWS